MRYYLSLSKDDVLDELLFLFIGTKKEMDAKKRKGLYGSIITKDEKTTFDAVYYYGQNALQRQNDVSAVGTVTETDEGTLITFFYRMRFWRYLELLLVIPAILILSFSQGYLSIGLFVGLLMIIISNERYIHQEKQAIEKAFDRLFEGHIIKKTN